MSTFFAHLDHDHDSLNLRPVCGTAD